MIVERGDDYNIEVKGVKISPDPVVRGKPAAFSISASTGEMRFRKMDDKKCPREFVPEADLQGIQSLPSDFDKWKRYKVEDNHRKYSSERGRRSAGMSHFMSQEI
ncbi:putative phosphatidylglycerol/phosphatidylinositol transfer protein [Cinnamomum micranthum f. kanehirae]|uniref:Putative phosphatidylglycerol/phosphatidylinositol transfer protein n=1 Tax=Cinnamomum micranthum f. kanehirae TaxID=337451 RepID=A0A3S3QLC2_9MAGN|nr:putative phosphatidylglycerol/phosphatidylinositol transfer protein [Cinnamomum micranthum f. kanehirae]